MLPLRKRTRRLPWRSVAQEQCLGRPLLVRSIDQDLVPRIGVDGCWLAELQHDTIWVDFSASDALAHFGSLFERASESRFARRACGLNGLRGARTAGTVLAGDNFFAFAAQRLSLGPLAVKRFKHRTIGSATRAGSAQLRILCYEGLGHARRLQRLAWLSPGSPGMASWGALFKAPRSEKASKSKKKRRLILARGALLFSFGARDQTFADCLGFAGRNVAEDRCHDVVDTVVLEIEQ